MTSQKKKLEKAYQEILLEKKSNLERLKKISDYKIVKEYFNLQEQIKNSEETENDILYKMNLCQYESCKHILVITGILKTSFYDTKLYYGCIKCGCDEDSARYLAMDEDQKIRNDYVKYISKWHLSGKVLDVKCDIDRAREIYSEIKTKYPKVSEDKKIELFKNEVKKEIESTDKNVRERIKVNRYDDDRFIDPLG